MTPSRGAPSRPSVAVVIPSFNHARFLGAALDSVAAQTRPADEIVVVDDGSTDDPASVVAGYPQVQLVTQENAGLSAARNAGLAAIRADYVLFLDADDVLCPTAIARNLALFAANPDAGFVYGAHNRVDADLRLLLGPRYYPIGEDPFATLLRGNMVGMHATALYSTAKLRAAGGFDPALKSCEDYDVFLTLAKRHPVASHDEVIALYRIHGQNMSSSPARMLKWVLTAHARHRPPEGSYLAYWKTGRREWKCLYADAAIDGAWGGEGGSLRAIVQILPRAPHRVLHRAGSVCKRALARLVARRTG